MDVQFLCKKINYSELRCIAYSAKNLNLIRALLFSEVLPFTLWSASSERHPSVCTALLFISSKKQIICQYAKKKKS